MMVHSIAPSQKPQDHIGGGGSGGGDDPMLEEVPSSLPLPTTHTRAHQRHHNCNTAASFLDTSNVTMVVTATPLPITHHHYDILPRHPAVTIISLHHHHRDLTSYHAHARAINAHPCGAYDAKSSPTTPFNHHHLSAISPGKRKHRRRHTSKIPLVAALFATPRQHASTTNFFWCCRCRHIVTNTTPTAILAAFLSVLRWHVNVPSPAPIAVSFRRHHRHPHHHSANRSRREKR
jgi:hypothetical protein